MNKNFIFLTLGGLQSKWKESNISLHKLYEQKRAFFNVHKLAAAVARAGERGGRGVRSTGARHVLRGPALEKFFFRDTREEMLEKLRLRYVRTYVQCAK